MTTLNLPPTQELYTLNQAAEILGFLGTEAERLYTLEQAAELLGLKSSWWLREKIRDGELEYINLNPHGTREKLRIRASSLNKLTREMTITTEQAA